MALASIKNQIEISKILLKEKKKPNLWYDFSHVFIC